MDNILKEALEFAGSLTDEQINTALAELAEGDGGNGYCLVEDFISSDETLRFCAAKSIWATTANEKTEALLQGKNEPEGADIIQILRNKQIFDCLENTFWMALREEFVVKKGFFPEGIGVRRGGKVAIKKETECDCPACLLGRVLGGRRSSNITIVAMRG